MQIINWFKTISRKIKSKETGSTVMQYVQYTITSLKLRNIHTKLRRKNTKMKTNRDVCTAKNTHKTGCLCCHHDNETCWIFSLRSATIYIITWSSFSEFLNVKKKERKWRQIKRNYCSFQSSWHGELQRRYRHSFITFFLALSKNWANTCLSPSINSTAKPMVSI